MRIVYLALGGVEDIGACERQSVAAFDCQTPKRAWVDESPAISYQLNMDIENEKNVLGGVLEPCSFEPYGLSSNGSLPNRPA